jgi:hypothetical protein
MKPTDDRREKKPLPITAEVGGEGGSFADRTMQAETFSGPAGVLREQGHGGASSAATYAVRQDYTSGNPIQTEPGTAGTVRYPTEPPMPPSATEGRRFGDLNWKAGLIGAAAGAGAAVVAAMLRKRR